METKVNEELCTLLRQAQGNRSQNQFALQSGVSSASITKVFQGSYIPSVKWLQKIAAHAHNKISFEMLMNAAFNIKEKQPKIFMNDENDNLSNLKDNTVISIGRGGEQRIYEIDEQDAEFVDTFLKKVAKKK